MQRPSKYSNRSPSGSSSNSNYRPQSPISSDYEYVGRLVTRERARNSSSKPIEQYQHFHSNSKYSTRAANRVEEEEVPAASDNEPDEDPDGLSRPLGIIRINDRHYREIYRLPTPPPKVKRVFHRLQSPEPKIIERVYVRRPPPQIIENVIEIPPEKVRIIHREKFLENSKPITRSKLVRLKAKDDETASTTTQQRSVPQQVSKKPLATPQGTAVVYPPQSNLRTVGYFESDIPPHIMLQQQQMNTNTQSSIFTNVSTPQPSDYPFAPGTIYPSQQPQTIPYSLYGYRQN